MRRGANAQSFVVDECNLDLAEFIRGYPVLSYRDLGLERGASDEKLVEHAGYRGAIIVSRNKRDFRHEMRRAAERSTLADCYEGAGLVSVPDDLPRFNFKTITRTMRFRGRPVSWEDVCDVNFEVVVHRDADHPPEIRLLPRCPKCLKNHEDCERCHRLGLAAQDYMTMA